MTTDASATPPPTLTMVSLTEIMIRLRPPAFDGGYPIATYDVYDSTLPGPSHTTRLELGHFLYNVTSRNPLSEYRFRVRAVTTQGIG